MLQPKSATRRISLGQTYDNGKAWPLESIVEPPPGGRVGPPAKKRRREHVGAPKKRHRSGQRGLCELNLDELYIIFAFIYPMDLLNLARTCKSLRGILMHKSSRFLWKTAFSQIEGLPPCPDDLTEPEYTNLVFYSRCHGCGKPAQTILWKLRRRFCPACRVERLRRLCHCDKIISEGGVLLADWSIVGDESATWVDRGQLDSFWREYARSSDKERFLDEKREQYKAIFRHARECEFWQQQKGRVHRFDLDILRKERQASIFERLKQRGYGPEIAYFKDDVIEKSYQSIFKKHNPLTDGEWVRIWPEWVKIMNNFRSQRLETAVYQPRRRSLVSEYDRYVTRPSPESPTLDFLPHVVDLTRFSVFKDILRAPEDTELSEEPFATAFAQLPMLANKWTWKLNSEIAGLVKIPSFLSSGVIFGGRGRAPSNIGRVAPFRTDSDKLRLACAVFHVGGAGAFFHPEVLSVSMGNDMMFPNHDAHLNAIGVTLGSICCEYDSDRPGSIYDRFGLQFLDEAPYIVYACGLDPNVATADDMDRRNARLICLCCGGRVLVMKWRHAIWHACYYHCIGIDVAPLCEVPRWQLVNDEYIDAIQAVERSVQRAFAPDWTRCLLCRPRVGDAMLYEHALRHIVACHGVERTAVTEGIHYKLAGIRDVCVVEMVQIRGLVAFQMLEE